MNSLALLLLLLSDAAPGPSTRSLEVGITCPNPPSTARIVIRHVDKPLETDSPQDMSLDSGRFKLTLLDVAPAIVDGTRASLRLPRRRTMCQKAKINKKDVAQYEFKRCVAAANVSLEITLKANSPKLSVFYERR